MIYFDNSATTFPKPPGVGQKVSAAIREYGGNPGRSGHSLSIKTAEKIFEVRNLAADFFKAKTENTVFTLNATHAINMAIKGIMSSGGHIIISSLEHNSVARPVVAMADKRQIDYSVARVFEDDDDTADEFESLIRPDTKCICCTVASNVTGQILPYRKIAAVCRRHKLCFIGDAAQAAGVLPITLDDGFDFICTSGHKGLYGPAGTGLLVTNGKFPLDTIIEGGTGATSAELVQTDFLPEQLESGTINTGGIIGLGEGIRFVKSRGISRIHAYETQLCRRFIERLKNNDRITLYRGKGNYAPIVSFNIGRLGSQEAAERLSDMGFGLRGGLQCAAIAHNFLGTTQSGVVRFSPSVFNSEKQVDALCNAIIRISKSL